MKYVHNHSAVVIKIMRGAMVPTHGHLESVKEIDNWIIVSLRAQIESGNDIGKIQDTV